MRSFGLLRYVAQCLALCLGWLVLNLTPVSASQILLSSWEFERNGDLQGWEPNGHLKDVRVNGGIVSCSAVGSDPILVQKGVLDLKAASGQAVEIRLKASRDGTAELFWSNTTEGRYGGFAQEKSTRFPVRGDGRWHLLRVLPCWQAEGKIIRLRLDLYDGAEFELDYIRVNGFPQTPPLRTVRCDFGRGVREWSWVAFDESEPGSGTVWDGRALRGGMEGVLWSPELDINSVTNGFVSLRFSADRGKRGTLFFATDQANGLLSQGFEIEADGRAHTYNVDLLPVKEWKGRVLALGLRPSDAEAANITLDSIAVGPEPLGPPQVKVVALTVASALPKVGVPTRIWALVANTGGQPVSNLVGQLILPLGLSHAGGDLRRVVCLDSDEPASLEWTVVASQPVDTRVRLQVSAANADRVEVSIPVHITQKLLDERLTYVPVPKPVRGPIEVGAYYFPGWSTAQRWQPLENFPERRPVLGWYREGDPEVADWHIKWAVEHGITFFAYDWYWSKGSRHLEHALHEGLFRARYRHLLKFCLLWANHNPPGSSSYEDCLAVTRYWIEHYFKRSEYLTFDGKPVMIIFSPHRLTEDLGQEGVKRAFTAMREECSRAGLKGLYLIACIGDTGSARRAAEEGYDTITAYNWPGLGIQGAGKYGSFETLIDGYRRNWEHLLVANLPPLDPLPISGGWDSRPWHGEANLVRFGRTPGLFRRHLQDAKSLLAGLTNRPPTRAVLVEAWNEWGEGSYIEPHAEFGFGYLDAIRSVFTDAPGPHDDLTPADAGLGPYEVEPAAAMRTEWSFDAGDDGWNSTMQLAGLQWTNGCLLARSTGNDPAFFGPAMRARASAFSAIGIRMSVAAAPTGPEGDYGQLFWTTTRRPEDESSSLRFPLRLDGKFHDYLVPVGESSRWRGIITRLRLDPGSRPGLAISIDYIRLVPRAGAE